MKIVASATSLSAASALSLQAFLMASTPYSGLDQDISDVDLWKYFEESDDDGFHVHNILLRRDNNFLQGFYYDPSD